LFSCLGRGTCVILRESSQYDNTCTVQLYSNRVIIASEMCIKNTNLLQKFFNQFCCCSVSFRYHYGEYGQYSVNITTILPPGDADPDLPVCQVSPVLEEVEPISTNFREYKLVYLPQSYRNFTAMHIIQTQPRIHITMIGLEFKIGPASLPL